MSAITIMLLSAVSASAADWTVNTDEGGDFTTIQDALDAAGFGDRILVSPGEYLEALDFAGLEVEVVGIDGAEATIIDASGLGEPTVTFATGEGSGSILSGFTLRNDTDLGVRIVSAGPALADLVLSGLGTGVELGGAIYIEGGTPSITGCTFNGNSAALGGHIYVTGYGELTVVDSSFSFGLAESGGAIHLSSLAIADLSGAIFNDNIATEDGGAIDMGSQASLTLEDARFQRNLAGRDGGGVYTSRGAVVDSRGGVWFGNQAPTGDGGALRIADEATLSFLEDDFIDNIAGLSGGAIALVETANALELSSCAFTNNTAADGGAIAARSYDVVTIEASEFDNNTATNHGGSIDVLSTGGDGSLSLTDTSFQTGTAADGGGIALVDTTGGFSAVIDNSVFSENEARSGGGVYAEGVTELLIDGGSASDNSAQAAGGAVALVDSFATLRDVSLDNNVAQTGGGALHGEGLGSLTLEGCDLYENVSQDAGGGISYTATSLSIEDSALRLNTAASAGGGVFVEADSALTMDGASFIGNTATEDGGGVYAWGVTYITAERSLFCGNAGRDGGGIWLREVGSEARVGNSRFLSNTASRYGGAVGVIASPALDVSNNAFVANAGGVSGATAYANSVGLTFVNNAVIDSAGDSALYGNSDTLLDATVGYNDWYGGSGDDLGGALGGVEEVGALSADPMFVDYVPDDCDSDLHLATGSPLIDAGDPAVEDLNGTRSDIGAFGGPGAPSVDVDGDGWSVEQDCDDENPDINPGMEEVWYDGVDSDCGGESDFDQDGDGYDHELYDGDDCDDEDDAVYPGAEDIAGDGIDQDCDGDDAFTEETGGGDDTATVGTDDTDDEDPDLGSGKRCSVAGAAGSGAWLGWLLVLGGLGRRRP